VRVFSIAPRSLRPQKDAPAEVDDEDMPEATVKEIDFEYAPSAQTLDIRSSCSFPSVCSEEMKESKESKENTVSAVAVLLSDATLKVHLEVKR
jgi:hypothetical protein